MSKITPDSEPILWMITGEAVTPSTEGEKSGGGHRGGRLGGDDNEESSQNGKTSLSIRKLQENLNQFLGIVGDLFAQAEQQAQISQPEGENTDKPAIGLDQIEFSVAVNAEGEVGFWGLGKGTVGGATEIKLTFKRKEG